MVNLTVVYFFMVLFYCSECVVYVPGRPVLFHRPLWPWRMVPGAGITFGKGTLLFLHPLPFLAEWHTCLPVQATPTSAGVISLASLRRYDRLPGDLAVYSSDALPDAVRKNLLATGYPSVKGVPVPASAQAFARWLDPQPLRERFTHMYGNLWLLKSLCTLQFLLLFAGAPLLLRFFGGFQILVPFLAATYSLGAGIALVYFLIFLRLHPQEKWLGAGKAMWVFLYPFAAMRAVSLLCKGCCPPCHESALALALFSQRQIRAFIDRAACLLRRQVFPRSLSQEAAGALEGANRLMLEALWRHAEAGDLPQNFWEAAGVPPQARLNDWKAQGAVCYCPVCLLPLTENHSSCPKCVDVSTLPVPGR